MSRYCGKTDIGLKRKRNEDHFLIGPQGNFFAIADGMGGHPAGDKASQLACQTFQELYNKKIKSITGLFTLAITRYNCQPFFRLLKSIFKIIDKRICSFGCSHKQCDGLGTTLSILIIGRGMAIIGHVGDSRIYRLRGKELNLLTVDHTFVQDLIDMGEITRQEAQTNPMRHVLMEALGQGIEKVYTRCERIRAGDLFLLCTDGLHDLVSENDIKQTLLKDMPLEKKCDLLIDMAKNAGGKDNITVLIVLPQY